MKKQWNEPELKASGVENTKIFGWKTVECPEDGHKCYTCHPGHYCHIFFKNCTAKDPNEEGGGGNEEPNS